MHVTLSNISLPDDPPNAGNCNQYQSVPNIEHHQAGGVLQCHQTHSGIGLLFPWLSAEKSLSTLPAVLEVYGNIDKKVFSNACMLNELMHGPILSLNVRASMHARNKERSDPLIFSCRNHDKSA